MPAPKPGSQIVAIATLSLVGLVAAVGLVAGSIPPVAAAVFGILASLAGMVLARSAYVEATNTHAELEHAGRVNMDLQEAARQHRDALDSFAEGLDVWIFLVDGNGSIQYANAKACEMFEFRDPLGQSILGVTFSRELALLIENADTNSAQEWHEVAFQHPRERIGMVRVWPHELESGRYFVSVYDVTDLRRLERARRDFVANVSHELRTPMATIRAIAETLLESDQPRTAEETRYMEKIVSEIDRLTRISNDLLTLSTAESKPPVMEALNLSDVCRAAVHQAMPKIAKKKLELVSEIEPVVRVNANGEQMTQVLLNLLDNAVNYTTTGTVTVRTYVSNGHARVEIQDTGIGISSEHIDRVFERFYRVDKARSRATGGTGLGLSIVRHLVESHGGKVGVVSVLNEGSTFWVELPAIADRP